MGGRGVVAALGHVGLKAGAASPSVLLRRPERGLRELLFRAASPARSHRGPRRRETGLAS